MKKKISDILFILGGVIIFLIMIVLHSYLSLFDNTFSRMLIVVVDTAACADLIILGYVIYSTIAHKNFFLYDFEQRKNLPESHLTYQGAAERIKAMFPAVFTEKLLTETLPDEIYPDAPRELTELILPFAFYHHAENNPGLLIAASSDTKDKLAASLNHIGEAEFAQAIKSFDSAEAFSSFWSKNKDSLSDALLRFIKERIKKY
jgi:hypothetical protein